MSRREMELHVVLQSAQSVHNGELICRQCYPLSTLCLMHPVTPTLPTMSACACRLFFICIYLFFTVMLLCTSSCAPEHCGLMGCTVGVVRRMGPGGPRSEGLNVVLDAGKRCRLIYGPRTCVVQGGLANIWRTSPLAAAFGLGASIVLQQQKPNTELTVVSTLTLVSVFFSLCFFVFRNV